MTHRCRPNLIAEVISIGDEMTSGARLDTNAQWLSRRLGELGVHVAFHSTVGDTLEDNVDVFRIASGRADVVVSTGGLGPTQDDLTREAMGLLVGQPLELDAVSLAHIETMFARRRRPMPPRNQVQAMFPVGARAIFNPQGTAPGVDMVVPGKDPSSCRIFALPGVPAEMKRMFDESVRPEILESLAGATCIRHAVMKFFGTGESDMEARLGDMISRDREPRVGITVSSATISLRITATGQTDQTCDAMIAQTRAEILERVSEFYFGDGETFEQHHAIDGILRMAGQSLAVVELGRSALLGDWFASLGPTSGFRGGLSLAQQADLLHLFDAESVEKSLDEVARRFVADWVLLVDAYPSLDATADTPIPAAEVAFVVRSPSGPVEACQISLGGHPDILQARIAKSAMAFLRKLLTP